MPGATLAERRGSANQCVLYHIGTSQLAHHNEHLRALKDVIDGRVCENLLLLPS